jgi:integrase
MAQHIVENTNDSPKLRMLPITAGSTRRSRRSSPRLGATHLFKSLFKRVGLPQTRFHDLRHPCATLLISKNVNPKIVSEMLGHATIAITLDTYSHVLPNMQSEAGKATEDALT